MESEALRYVFANAASAIVLRANHVAAFSNHKRNLCRAIAVGFSLSESIGDEIHSHSLEYNPSNVVGFGAGSYYESFESVIKGVLDSDSSTSNLTSAQREVLAASVNAILYGYALNPNATEKELYKVIGRTLYDVAERIYGVHPFAIEREEAITIVSHPFTSLVITSIYSQCDYYLVANQVKSSPKEVEVDLVHYNYYDMTNVFAGPNLEKMRDAENQYYYISGGLAYPQLPSGLVFCEEETVTITTLTGERQVTVINNLPCIDEDTFTGPLTGTKFYRAFNDGPYSSGDFNSEVKESFISFDKSKLSGVDYSGNLTRLYSYYKIGTGNQYHTIHDGGVQKDIEGLYNLTHEYSNSPMPYSCLAKYQIMRVGDGRIRSQCVKYDINGNCTECKETLATGFKYVNLNLDENLWEDKFAYVLSNPPTDINRTMIRALNMATNPYKGSVYGNEIISALPDGLGGYTWYIGPPQIGTNDLPFFAFTNVFQNNTFEKEAKVVVFPAIGSSSAGGYSNSSRSFQVSEKPLFTGTDSSTSYTIENLEDGDVPKAVFSQTVLPFENGDDEIKTKVLGMGNAFDGKYSITETSEENAGYFYSGYTLKDSNNISYSEITVAKDWEGYKVGSPYSQVKYISGYTGKNSLEISRLYAHDTSGNNIQYYYFDNRLLPGGVEIKGTGLTSFAQLPTSIEADSNYKRAYAYQRVENNYQRYYKGPYATYIKKFLYPNASKVTEQNYDNDFGFPTKFEYKIKIREETVKELYAKFIISNGWVYNSPDYIQVVRTPQSNFGAYQPVMSKIFSAGGYNFDFNQWNISKIGFFYSSGLSHAVDNEYATVNDGYVIGATFFPYIASGKNNVTYTSSPTFKQGILITGNSVQTHQFYSGDNKTSGLSWYTSPPIGVGLYHGFSGYEITGYLTYTKPIFNLNEGKIDRTFATGALPLTKSGCISYYYIHESSTTPSISNGINRLYTKDMNGRIFYSKSGQDPIYFKEIGGRRGGINATGEGGYHPKGIIGDTWMGLFTEQFGCWCSNWSDVCEDGDFDGNTHLNYGIDALTNDNRTPTNDRRWIYVNVGADETNIYTRALDFNPMGFDYVNPKYNSNSSTPTISKSASFTFEEHSKSFKLNLSALFPLKTQTSSDEWYVSPSSSGVCIGPFDRDVELFVGTGQSLTGYNYIYINNRRLTDLEDGYDAACYSPKSLTSQTFTEDGFIFNNIKSIFFVPSGDSAVINLKGTTTFTSASKIGFPSPSYLYIRARTVLNESEYHPTDQLYLKVSGSNTWLHNFNFINNGSERVFNIKNPTTDPQSLKGTVHSFTTFSRSGKFYPKPDSSELNAYWSTGKNGNEQWAIKNIEDFYKKKTAKENSLIYITGWREGSRISFEFVDVIPRYDDAPLENHKVVIPSGNCIITGEMGYLGQADKSIFTEGISLEDVTENDVLRDRLYGPKYISPVLKRITTITYPEGTYKNPVFDAPSVMKQRNTMEINPEPTYSGLMTNSPDNYNKLLWPALSDLCTLNPDETLEEIPPVDGNTFNSSTLLISAAQGQNLPNGKTNPDITKRYAVREQYQMYDSVSTDAIINSGYFVTANRGTVTELVQPESGHTVPRGTTLTDIKLGLI